MDDFQRIFDKIEALQAEHKKLELSLPRLAELKKMAQEDLNKLNRELGEVLSQLDEARKMLATLDEERDLSRQRLKVERNDFETECRHKTDDLDKRALAIAELTQSLRDSEAVLDAREADMATAEANLLLDQANLAERIRVMTEQELAAAERVQEAERRHADMDARQVELDKQAAGLTAREATIAESESQVADLLRQAESKVQEAQRIMDKADNKAINIDAKENELVKREVALETRKAQLDQRETGIRDKELVRQSHG